MKGWGRASGSSVRPQLCLSGAPVCADWAETLVLDEADRLLDQGFRRELMKILETLPNKSSVDRQTLLFTATIPEGIRQVGCRPSLFGDITR